MSKVHNIKKAMQVQKKLERSFADTPAVTIRLTHVEDHSIHITATYEGSAEFQCDQGTPTHTALYKSDRVFPNDLYRHMLHPLDHWVDVMVQQDTLTQEGKL